MRKSVFLYRYIYFLWIFSGEEYGEEEQYDEDEEIEGKQSL